MKKEIELKMRGEIPRMQPSFLMTVFLFETKHYIAEMSNHHQGVRI
ncbi:hypothetical protein [Alteribacillus sp. HJP-4]